jgi:tight adherence protein B
VIDLTNTITRTATAVAVAAMAHRLVIYPAPRQPPISGGDATAPADAVADWCAALIGHHRAGYGTTGAIANANATYDDINAVRHVATDATQRQRSLSEALDEVAPNVSPDLRVVIAAISAATASGSAVSPAVIRAEQVLRRRADQRREITVAAASTRMSAVVLTVLPIVVLGVAGITSATVRVYATSPAGRLTIGIGMLLAGSGWWWIRRLTDTRRVENDDELLDALEELIVRVSAGVSLLSAMRRTATTTTGLTGDALRDIVRRCDEGDLIADAIDALPGTCGDDIAVAIGSLATAQRTGTALSSALVDATDDIARIRDSTTRAHIRTLPVRLTAPLAVCVLPAFIAVALVPTIAAALTAVRGTTP